MAFSGAQIQFGDGTTYTGAANSDTVPTFQILGGKYALFGHSSGTYSAQLQAKTPSGSFVSVAAADTSGYVTYDLPFGTYQILVGASGGTQDGALIRIPYRQA